MKIMNVENNVLPMEINLVHFDKPQLIDNKSKQTSSAKQGEYPTDFGDGQSVELSCSNVLNRILPPRQWNVNGLMYSQKLSNLLATKLEVKKLGEKLDTYLERFEVKEVGICPIKRELYTQCFNEVIRQVTLNCAERGFLLIEIRDEMNATIDTNQKLFESVTAHGIRKALLRKHKEVDLEKRAEELKMENERLNAELVKITVATAQLEREKSEVHAMENKRRAEELNELKMINQELKEKLQSIVFKTRLKRNG